MKEKQQVKCDACGDILVYSTCNGCARRDYEGMREFQKKYIDCDHERREVLRQLDEVIKAAREAKRMLLEHGYHPQAAVISELDKITIMKMNPGIARDSDVQRKPEPATGWKAKLGIQQADPETQQPERQRCSGPHTNPGMKNGKLLCHDCGFPV